MNLNDKKFLIDLGLRIRECRSASRLTQAELAAKSGLHGATKALSLELASRGITVNAVAPGIIASPMIEGSFDKEMIARLVPMKRAGTVEEVADLIGFLASDRAGYISGQIISINGGMI